jgi:diacylglycerol kinase family enzyme
MRALLVVNTFATTTSPEIKAVISAALENNLDLTVVTTEQKLHAVEIAKTAKSDGYELIIGFGGDGTLNELANGLLANGLDPTGPKLAGIPGGNANVFLRNLGYANDPIIATAQLLENLAKNSTKTIGLGKLTSAEISRWFLFNAGFGIDAQVLAKMDLQRNRGKYVSDSAYAMLAIRELFNEIRKSKSPILITDQNNVTAKPVQFALIVNSAPWTYVGKYAVSPLARLADTSALDIFGSYKLSISNTARLISGFMSADKIKSDPQVLVLEQQNCLDIKAITPTWTQVDGEPLMQIKSAKVEHFANCLTVIA